MAHLKMLFGNAIFMALCFVWHVTGIMGTVSSFAEEATIGLADVAHMSQFETAVRSSSPEWYQDGMQLYAHTFTNHWWVKRAITWGITKPPKRATIESILEALNNAFIKWGQHIPSILFLPATPFETNPDIRIEFEEKELPYISEAKLTAGSVLDYGGVTLVFGEHINWTHPNHPYYCNFHFAALHEIGHALGLGDSKEYGSVMYENSIGFTLEGDPSLTVDDVTGIKKLYDHPSIQPGGALAPRPAQYPPSAPPYRG